MGIYETLLSPFFLFLDPSFKSHLLQSFSIFNAYRVKFDRDRVRKQLLLAVIMIRLDFILKGSVANAIYQPILRKATEF